MPSDVTLLTDGDEIIAKVQAPRVEEAAVAAEVAEGEEAAEGAEGEGGGQGGDESQRGLTQRSVRRRQRDRRPVTNTIG